ncbi:MAG TPA: hypothetical protein VND94_02565 [Terriglobia bacterium]|nr:hypothetical protein [Terriglobia bacterium]
MMRLTIALAGLLLIAMLLAGCVTGQEKDVVADNACHQVPPPTVSIDIAFVGPIDDASRSLQELSHEETDGRGPAMERSAVTFGITHVKLGGQFGGDAKAATMPDGEVCAWANHLTVHLTDEVRVYLAAELRPGSCPYRAVREHEEKHVNLDRQLQPELRRALQEAIDKVATYSVLGRDEAAAAARLRTAFRQAVGGAIGSYAAMRDQRQIAIDTPEEYRRVQGVCGRPAFAALFPKT